MLLKCVRSSPAPDAAPRLGNRYTPSSQVFPVRVGAEYTAFGLEQYGDTVWAYIEFEDLGYLVSVPLMLFAIEDGSIPPSWQAHSTADGELRLLPPELLDPFFLDDLSSGVTEAVQKFIRLRAQTLNPRSPDPAIGTGDDDYVG